MPFIDKMSAAKTPQLIQEYIKNNALHIGFDACGIAEVKKFDDEASYWHNYIQKGFHAGMDYLSRNIDKRMDIKLLFPPAESIIVVLKNYFPIEKQENSSYKIAKYAYGKNYHDVLKKKLEQLALAIKNKLHDMVFRIFVDTAPVLEKEWAQRAGLGWIGKNTCLINKKFGSFTFIGILATNLKLQADIPHQNYCGTCNLCINTCPAQALQQPYQLNANKCISYQTIEQKTPLKAEQTTLWHNNIFGCDACQDVCPWNETAISHNDNELKILDIIKNYTNKDWDNLNKQDFNTHFKKSALKRAGFEKLKDNIKQAAELCSNKQKA